MSASRARAIATRLQPERWRRPADDDPAAEFTEAGDAREVRLLLGSPSFRAGAAELAAELGRSEESVLREAGDHLRVMSATHEERVTDVWHRFGHWMLRGYDLLVDEEALARIRALDHEHCLVFLISHRSYLDEWVLPPTLVEFGVDPPFGFAGANLDFFPLGTIARRTGIVHIRRSTGDAPVYKFALRAFMAQLVDDRANLIWSIEGGRSRTGKLRPPRLGLLRYVVDAVDDARGSDVLLVPVSIIYDQLPNHEVKLMTSEARGHGKTPEDARWFVGYLRGLRHRLGHIYVDFGDPVPLRGRLRELTEAGADDKHAVERIALEVSHRINQATPMTATAAVCVAALGADRALTLDEILTTVEPLAAYLQARRWPIAGGADLRNRATIRRAAQDLVASGVLVSFTGTTTVWGVGADQHLIAAVYRNNAIHLFVLRAIVELVLVRVADSDGDAPNAWDEALRLRDLLKFEFFFADRAQFARDLRFEVSLIDPDTPDEGARVQPDEARNYLKLADLLVAHLVLRPYLDAYAVVAEQLLQTGESAEFDESKFMAKCLSLGRQWAMQHEIANEESVSVEMFQNALRLARHRGLVEPSGQDLVAGRERFADELRSTRQRIDDIARLAREKGNDPVTGRG